MIYVLEMRDSRDDAWELQERFSNDLDWSIALEYYSNHPAFTGTYWRILKGRSIWESGRFR